MNDSESDPQELIGRAALERRLFNHSSDFKVILSDLDFTDAVVDAVQKQPLGWNVRDPQTLWARTLLADVQGRLPARDKDYVALYLSINCALARYYHVSAFLMLQREERHLGLATIALTTDFRRIHPDECRHFVYAHNSSDDEYVRLYNGAAFRLTKTQRGLLRASRHYGISLVLPPPRAPGPP